LHDAPAKINFLQAVFSLKLKCVKVDTGITEMGGGHTDLFEALTAYECLIREQDADLEASTLFPD
jgi:hypothetical protein